MDRKQAQRIVREYGSAMMLHTLYQVWGLPTALLKPLFESAEEGGLTDESHRVPASPAEEGVAPHHGRSPAPAGEASESRPVPTSTHAGASVVGGHSAHGVVLPTGAGRRGTRCAR